MQSPPFQPKVVRKHFLKQKKRAEAIKRCFYSQLGYSLPDSTEFVKPIVAKAILQSFMVVSAKFPAAFAAGNMV